MNLNLRSLRSCDAIPGFKDLLQRALADADLWHIDPKAASERLGALAYGACEALLIVAEDGQQAVQGFAISVPFEDPLDADRRPLLLFMWVAAPLRRHGIARALVVELRRLLKAGGYEGLQARIPHGDDALLAMGERWGLVRQWELLSDY